MAKMSCKFGEIIKKLKAVEENEPNQTSPKHPPPPAKSDGKYFPRVFHVVIPDPPF
jgi:hypothetical protein